VRTLSLMLMLAALLGWAAPAAADSAVSLPASTGVAREGDVVVPISVDPADGVVGMDFTIQYDPAVLTPTGVYTTAYTNGFQAQFNVPSPGQLRIGMFATSPLAGSGEVVWVVFHSGFNAVPTSLTLTQHDLNEGQIPSHASNGQVSVDTASSTLSLPDDARGNNGSTVPVRVRTD